MWKFLKSCPEQCFSENQFAFIGRSNVGKSSLINALARQKIARISSTPGKTQLLNYYQTSQNKLIVDLPGYGYARLSHAKKDQIESMIFNYFSKNSNILLVFLLVDSQIGFTDLDFSMIEFLVSLNIKVQILANKIDKTNQSQRSKLLKVCKNLSLECLNVSAKTGANLDKIHQIINQEKISL
ncbi:ribosome biogenesis GTP-binding protein YihA/YsxC [Mesomycoplasma ovipneumoniae]|uniref:ribosome biogenesis GTP-binding protein YihA/YsxC n=1 Tax=Mesomycoplasma ovipneumoniae TaxID=29562 RepID=UPI0020795EB0|nr:ribosome biogenesis GTP-binding protein YihA/YsxC [Mesomycoplasma ovipneumoniae]MCN0158029.1 ribosome biogenesis GTP-binding protein YihA/YsxC [Mesomycoplasma ovipneumoniae]